MNGSTHVREIQKMKYKKKKKGTHLSAVLSLCGTIRSPFNMEKTNVTINQTNYFSCIFADVSKKEKVNLLFENTGIEPGLGNGYGTFFWRINEHESFCQIARFPSFLNRFYFSCISKPEKLSFAFIFFFITICHLNMDTTKMTYVHCTFPHEKC